MDSDRFNIGDIVERVYTKEIGIVVEYWYSFDGPFKGYVILVGTKRITIPEEFLRLV